MPEITQPLFRCPQDCRACPCRSLHTWWKMGMTWVWHGNLGNRGIRGIRGTCWWVSTGRWRVCRTSLWKPVLKSQDITLDALGHHVFSWCWSFGFLSKHFKIHGLSFSHIRIVVLHVLKGFQAYVVQKDMSTETELNLKQRWCHRGPTARGRKNRTLGTPAMKMLHGKLSSSLKGAWKCPRRERMG